VKTPSSALVLSLQIVRPGGIRINAVATYRNGRRSYSTPSDPATRTETIPHTSLVALLALPHRTP
jgi:hypothetical protein